MIDYSSVKTTWYERLAAFLGRMAATSLGLFRSGLNVIVTVFILGCVIYVSFGHSLGLFAAAGASEGEALASVLTFELAFIMGEINLIWAHISHQKPGIFTRLSFWAGAGMVVWSNVHAYWPDSAALSWSLVMPVLIGLSTPLFLILSVGVLSEAAETLIKKYGDEKGKQATEKIKQTKPENTLKIEEQFPGNIKEADQEKVKEQIKQAIHENQAKNDQILVQNENKPDHDQDSNINELEKLAQGNMQEKNEEQNRGAIKELVPEIEEANQGQNESSSYDFKEPIQGDEQQKSRKKIEENQEEKSRKKRSKNKDKNQGKITDGELLKVAKRMQSKTGEVPTIRQLSKKANSTYQAEKIRKQLAAEVKPALKLVKNH